VIVLITLGSLVFGLIAAFKQPLADVYHQARRYIARGILLGLEFLVAADIIHTVAVDLSFESVGVLAIVVAIRIFLSFSLEVEITGKWPWQSDRESSDERANASRPR
jgi:uncharacterized membrane protein